jgi:hypothetical protein
MLGWQLAPSRKRRRWRRHRRPRGGLRRTSFWRASGYFGKESGYRFYLVEQCVSELWVLTDFRTGSTVFIHVCGPGGFGCMLLVPDNHDYTTGDCAQPQACNNTLDFILPMGTSLGSKQLSKGRTHKSLGAIGSGSRCLGMKGIRFNSKETASPQLTSSM